MHPQSPHDIPTPQPETGIAAERAVPGCRESGCRGRRWRVCGRPGCSGMQAYPARAAGAYENRRRAVDDITPNPDLIEELKPLELWRQDPLEPDLWHHSSGLIVNGAALEERGRYYRVIRTAAAGGGGADAANLPAPGA